MKRYGHLWEEVISLENLYRAAKQAARGKRNRSSVKQFMFYLEYHLCRLHEQLKDKTYRPGAYKVFTIYEPKERIISAAPFRDRVVHHALCHVLNQIYERSFHFHSYASRVGKGTHAAIQRCQNLMKQYSYCLKFDVRKYFPSISHNQLKEFLRGKIKDPHVIWLIDLIIDNSNPQESVEALFPEEMHLPEITRRRGLPIGNQTSQFFANVYLDMLDQWLATTGWGAYLRFMDDGLIFSNNKQELQQLLKRIDEKLKTWGLRLHKNKCHVSPCWQGAKFLGQRVFPTHRLLPKENVRRFRRRLQGMRAAYLRGEMDEKTANQRIQSWLGHAKQADSYRVRQRVFLTVHPKSNKTG